MFNEVDKISENGVRTVITYNPNDEYVLMDGDFLNLIILIGGEGFVDEVGGAKNDYKIDKKCKIIFKGVRAKAVVLGFVIGNGNLNLDFEMVADHVTNGSTSDVLVKAVLFDNVQFDFKGNLIIRENADQSDTFLGCHSLLIGNGSATRSVPSLEISANQVKAKHASTSGKIDQEALFYLGSRGIPLKTAKNLLIAGFFEDILQKVYDIDLRDSLRQFIIKSLPY